MPYLIAAVVLVGAIAVLNLLLTMAVIRRLRRNEANMPGMPMMDTGPAAGSPLPEFAASSTAGDDVSNESFMGSAGIAAFFSTTCSACKPAIPQLVDHIEKAGFTPQQALVVIAGEGDERAEFTAMFDGKATVITEGELDKVATAFSISAFPSFVHFDESGVVTRSHSGSGTLSEAV